MPANSSQPRSDFEIFGPYEVYERLGVGGMATVHRAKERGIEGFERIVALKRLLPHLAEDASFVRAFVREAKLASRLQHANIVQLYELGRVGSEYFISMEYIEGNDVRKLLRQARRVAGLPPLPVFLSLMIQLCDALDYAHRRTDEHGQPLGLVHRDVSPSNLLITESGHLKVIDFGIAKAQSQHLRTQTGRVKGKLAYLAPEALRGQDLDARSDIFAVGVVAHELLTARPLFAGKNDVETLARVQRAEVLPPSVHNPACPPELDDLVLKALARDRDQRWAAAAELRDALEFFRSQRQISANNRDVAEWVESAFAQDAPPRTSRRMTSVSDAVSGSFSSGYPVAPQRAFARPGSATDSVTFTPVAMIDADEPDPLPPPPAASGFDPPEEEAANFAWGGEHENVTGMPVLLDDVPDYSGRAHVHQVSDDAATRIRVGSSSLHPSDSDEHQVSSRDFGASILGQRPKRASWAAMALGVLALIGGAVYLLAFRDRGGAASPATTASIVQKATLKVAVDPADATIEISGYGTHQGAPYQLQVEAPGTYRIGIQRDGYKRYVTEVEVGHGETHALQVVLQQGGSAKAQVSVQASMAAEHLVYVDGTLSGERIPLTLEVAEGDHVLVIMDREGKKELWRREFSAAANTQYEFHPDFAKKDRANRELQAQDGSHRRRGGDDERDHRNDAHQVAPKSPVLPAEEASGSPAAPGDEAAQGSSLADTAAGETIDLPEPQVRTAPEISSTPARPAASTPPVRPAISTPVRPAAPLPVRPAPSSPVTIPPAMARLVDGDLPTIPAATDVPSRASAKLCIDTAGKVTKAELLTSMPAAASLRLKRAFKHWRYKPHMQNGQAVPACFALNFVIRLEDR